MNHRDEEEIVRENMSDTDDYDTRNVFPQVNHQ